jgi:glycosyltransferase involved in cell wall biosynthesis
MPDYYQRAALHVMTSLNEVVPMSTLEAAACGLPTVSTAVGILPDYPTMGVTVPMNDDAALAGAIAELLADDQRRAILGQSAYVTARDFFCIERTVEQYQVLYEQLR